MPDPNVTTMTPANPIKQPTTIAQPVSAAADASAAAPDPTTISSPSAMPSLPASQPQAPAYGGWQTHGIGRILNTVLGGNKLVYRQGDDGTAVPEQVPMKPGEMFKNILGAGILGLAAGAGTKDFGSGFQRGYGAQKQQQDQDEAEARQQAQQSFENKQKQQEMQLKKNEDARQAQALKLQERVTQANIEHLEAQKITESMQQARLHIENDQLAVKNFTENEAYYAPQKTVLDAAGVKPKATVAESEVKPEPGVFRIPVGHVLKPVTDKDGNTKFVPEQLVAIYDQKDLNKATVTKQFQDQIITVMGHTDKSKTDQQWRAQVEKLIPVGSNIEPSKLAPLLSTLQSNWATMRENEKFQAQIAESRARANEANQQAALASFNLANAKEEKSVKEAFSLATSGEKLSPAQEKLVKTNRVKIASWLNTESMAAEKELTAISGQYQSVVKAGQTPDETLTKAYQAASSRYDYMTGQRKRFEDMFGGGALDTVSGQSASGPSHFQTSDGIYKLPSSKVDSFKKQFGNAVPRPDLDRAEAAGLMVDPKGIVLPPKVTDGYNQAIQKIKNFDPMAASRIESYLTSVIGQAPLKSGTMRPLDANTAKTAQSVIDSEIADMNKRMQANAEADRVNR